MRRVLEDCRIAGQRLGGTHPPLCQPALAAQLQCGVLGQAHCTPHAFAAEKKTLGQAGLGVFAAQQVPGAQPLAAHSGA